MSLMRLNNIKVSVFTTISILCFNSLICAEINWLKQLEKEEKQIAYIKARSAVNYAIGEAEECDNYKKKIKILEDVIKKYYTDSEAIEPARQYLRKIRRKQLKYQRRKKKEKNTGNAMTYSNYLGYQAGRNTLDILKFAWVAPYERFGIGTTLFSYYKSGIQLNYDHYTKTWMGYTQYAGSGLADLDLVVIAPIELYFVPLTWQFENNLGSLYLYGTFCNWATTTGHEAIDWWEYSGTGNAKYRDIGIGINIGKYVTIKYGHQKISVPDFVGDDNDYTYTGEYRVKGGAEEKWSIGIEFYFGSWKPGKKGYQNRSYGFIPWITEPAGRAIREAKRKREDKKHYSEYIKIGKKRMNNGDFAQAVIAFEEAERYELTDEGSRMLKQAKKEAKRTANYWNYYNEGSQLLEIGQAHDAIKALTKALSYCDTIYLFTEEKRSVKLQLGKAELLYKKLKQQYTQHMIAGEKELEQKRYDNAISEFKKAEKIFKMEEVELKIKKAKRQKEEARKQELYNRYYSKGFKYFSKGGAKNYENAIEEFEKALKYKKTKEAKRKLKEAKEKYKGASRR